MSVRYDHRRLSDAVTNGHPPSYDQAVQLPAQSEQQRDSTRLFEWIKKRFFRITVIFCLCTIIICVCVTCIVVFGSNRSSSERSTAALPPTSTSAPIVNDGLCATATWNHKGVTVAGGNGAGLAANQLHHPAGVFVDDDGNLYVADSYNHRVVKWAHGVSSGRVVAGNGKAGNHSDLLNFVSSIVVDKNGTMFICDRANRRIQRWFKDDYHGQTIIANISCLRLGMDRKEWLYISQGDDDVVTKWPSRDVVAGGNGRGSGLNQLSYPHNVYTDRDQSIFVADLRNHRVMKWAVDSKEGTIVAGGNGKGDRVDQLDEPVAVIVDQMGTMYILEHTGYSVKRWFKGAKSGTRIIGGLGLGNRDDQLSWPLCMKFDRHGNLYVADNGNHRVQMFVVDKSSCV